jgi:PAS domain S-box-containing protein
VTQRKEDEETLEEYRTALERLIDERTRALEQSESRMQSVIARGNVPIVFADVHGVITFANAAFQSLTGFSESELMGTRPWDTIYDERTKTDDLFLQRRSDFYAEKIDQLRQDVTIRRKDDETRWIDLTVSAVRDSDENRIQIIFILLDITERYTMTQAIEEANELARIMLDTAPLGCTLCDQYGNVLDCNMEVHKLFGLPSKQDYCDRFFDLSPEYQPDGQRTVDKFLKAVGTVFETGYIRFEWLHQKLDGSPLPCEITAVRVKREEGDIAVCYARDLREEKKDARRNAGGGRTCPPDV